MKNQKSNWLLDVVILSGFLVSFFLNLTGIAVHQWLGLSVFLGIMLHLVNHFDWVKNVVSRFFGKTSARARAYAIIDGLLLYGFVLILETGLVISTWFNLSLANYDVWLDIHVYSSICTLLLAVIKVGLHWRWIVKTAKKIFVGGPHTVPQGSVSLPQVSVVSRRDFLTTMGLVGLGSALAISNVLPIIKKADASSEIVQSNDAASSTAVTESLSQQTAASTPTQAAGVSSTELPTALPTSQPTSLPTATSQAVAQNSLFCTQGCPKGQHCSYPGRCGRYIDQNANGLCDLGECG